MANQLLTVTAFMLLFPTISYFHTLVHLFAPLALLLAAQVQAEREGRRVERLGVAIALFVPLFGSFMLLTERQYFLFGGLLQSLLLLTLFYLGACFPFAAQATAIVRKEARKAPQLQTTRLVYFAGVDAREHLKSL